MRDLKLAALEFSDFDLASLPAECGTLFKDISWHNDSCPSFEVDAMTEVTLYVDYPDHQAHLAEWIGDERMLRYCVIRVGLNFTEEIAYTDDWEAVLLAIASCRM